MQLAKKQRGISMVEMILGVAVAAAFMVILAKMQASASNDMRAKNNADSLMLFMQMATKYLDANRAGIQAAADTGTTPEQYCVINANATTGLGGTTANNTTLNTCAVDAGWMKYKKLLPADYRETNPYNQKWTAIYRVVYADYDNNAGTPVTTNGDIEMLVVGATNGGKEISSKAGELGLTAELAGGQGGYIPADDWGVCKYVTAGTKEACGTGAGWRATLSNFINTP